jgi:two-component system, OmpR family, response regulator BaeR
MTQRILIVEDEQDLAGILRDYLKLGGFDVDIISDGIMALQALKQEPPDLMILDLMLPGMDGLSILRELRKTSTLPVIVLTARVEEIDRLLGLEFGADDYVCKPYSPREVVLRVKTVLRRLGPTEGEKTGDRKIRLDPSKWSATIGDQRLELTSKEFQLLNVFMMQPGRVYSRGQLLDAIYEDNLEISERAVDSHLKNIRRKISELCPDYDPIRSIYGVGFVFDPGD